MSTLNLGTSLILDTDYSTSEKKTGATWIDGKPIYSKVFNCTLGNDTNPVSVAHNIANVYDIIDIKGYASSIIPQYYPVQWYNGGAYFGVYADRTNIILRTSLSDLFSRTASIVLFYTKTTD